MDMASSITNCTHIAHVIRLAIYEPVGHTVIQSYNASAKFDCSSNYDSRGKQYPHKFIIFIQYKLQHKKPTRLKRINMFVTSTSIKFLLSTLLYLSVAENQLQEGMEGAFSELEEDRAGSLASRVLDFIIPVATVFAMGSQGPL